MVGILAVEASSERYKFRIEGKSKRTTEGSFAFPTRRSVAFPTEPGEDHEPAAMPHRSERGLH